MSEKKSPPKKSGFFQTKGWKKFRQLDIFLDVQVPFLILLLLTVILRLPSIFETYYYHDEGIYLTIGRALNSGWRLYTDIFDHKTPLVYGAAALVGGNILTWRLLGMGLSLIALFFFNLIAQRLIRNKWLAWLAGLIFVLGFNLPIFEGNVVNAEIFFVTLGLAGAYFWLKSKVLNNWVLNDGEFEHQNVKVIHEKKVATELTEKKKKATAKNKKADGFWTKIDWRARENWLPLILAASGGVFFSLSFLTKFQGLFDLAAWIIPILFLSIWQLKEKRPAIIGLVGGFLVPILVMIILFAAQGNLGALWQNGFYYSFQYSEYTKLGDSAVGQAFFSITGKIVMVLVYVGLMWSQARYLDLRVMIAGLWLVLSLAGASLSNRNYPHYYLQIVPPLALTVAVLIKEIIRLWSTIKKKLWQPLAASLGLLATAMVLLGVYWHELEIDVFNSEARTKIYEYYENYVRYALKKQNIFGFYDYYDSRIKDNYAIAELITTDENPYLFIWGEVPELYAQTGKLPITPFLANYHMYDYDQMLEQIEPVQLILRNWQSKEPTYVVIREKGWWSDEEQRDWLILGTYLEDHYTPIINNGRLQLWKLNDTNG